MRRLNLGAPDLAQRLYTIAWGHTLPPAREVQRFLELFVPMTEYLMSLGTNILKFDAPDRRRKGARSKTTD